MVAARERYRRLVSWCHHHHHRYRKAFRRSTRRRTTSRAPTWREHQSAPLLYVWFAW